MYIINIKTNVATKNPPSIDELKEFEDDMLKMIQSTKLKQVNNPFLKTTKTTPNA